MYMACMLGHNFTILHLTERGILLLEEEEVYRDEPVIMPLSPGGGFVGLVNTYLGAPAIMAGVGDAKSNPHGPNESIPVSDYLEGIRFVATLLARFAEVSQ